jgi:hypothetical protein
MDQESHAGDREIGADIVMLDDITPRYAKATAALSACNASLGVALAIPAGYQDPGTVVRPSS